MTRIYRTLELIAFNGKATVLGTPHEFRELPRIGSALNC